MQAKKDLEKQRQRLAQKDEALARKDEMLKTLVQNMLQSGSSATEIARLTGRTPEEIERMR